MHRTRFFGVALAAAIVCQGGLASAQTAKRTFAKAVAAYRGAETLQAQFEQTLTNTLVGSTSSARGTLYRERPNLFAIDFAKPLTDRIVCDGKALWVYLPSSVQGQVIKTPVAKGSDGTPLDPLGMILTTSADRYTVSDAGTAVIGGKETHAVTLIPKPGDPNGLTKATLWVDDTDGSVRQFETEESNGVRRHVVITKLVMNGSLPRTAFTFVPPTGARVIER